MSAFYKDAVKTTVYRFKECATPQYKPSIAPFSFFLQKLSFSPFLSQILLLQQYPQLKQCVKPAVEKAVQDLLLPVAERSIKIALTTTEHIVKKVATVLLYCAKISPSHLFPPSPPIPLPPPSLLSLLPLISPQDFALDPDIHRMHLAAHHMVRHLTAGMALITCREPLLLSISSNVKNAFTSALRVRS